jgi:hypothetical protein
VSKDTLTSGGAIGLRDSLYRPTDNGETQLSGPVVDQAALYGLLIKVRDLGLPLVSVNATQAKRTELSDRQTGEHP